ALHSVTRQDLLRIFNGPSYSDILAKSLEQKMEGTGKWFVESQAFMSFATGNTRVLWGTGMRKSIIHLLLVAPSRASHNSWEWEDNSGGHVDRSSDAHPTSGDGP